MLIVPKTICKVTEQNDFYQKTKIYDLIKSVIT